MGSVGNTSNIESPRITGDYKATQQMIDTVMGIAKNIQKDFLILAKSFEIKFSKYMGSSAGMGFGDRIELNGAYFKKLIAKGYNTDEITGLIAHELTHTMQSRLLEGLTGEARKGNTERIWNNAINNYLVDNPDMTIKDVNKMVANAYSGGGHSRYGSSPNELMAVAVENAYSNGYVDVAKVGRYVIEELKREMGK